MNNSRMESSVTPPGIPQPGKVMDTDNAPGATIELPVLPFALTALEPHLSLVTLRFHHGKHHRTYVDTLNKLITGTPMAGKTLENIIVDSAGPVDMAAIFENASQAWNHSFYWKSLKPGGGGPPAGRLAKMIVKAFGSWAKFRADFCEAGVAHLGSGWVWLAQAGNSLEIVNTANAETPIRTNDRTPLITCDVWEHAYYVEYQHRRVDYVQAFLDHLINWEFAAAQLK